MISLSTASGVGWGGGWWGGEIKELVNNGQCNFAKKKVQGLYPFQKRLLFRKQGNKVFVRIAFNRMKRP